MAAIWAGIDAGKSQHHCVVIDEAAVLMSWPYRGEGKTDAKDAAAIADQARMSAYT